MVAGLLETGALTVPVLSGHPSLQQPERVACQVAWVVMVLT